MDSEERKTSPFAFQDNGIQIQTLNSSFLLKGLLKNIVRLGRMNEIYSKISSVDDQALFLDRLLESLHVNYRVSEDDIKKIPVKGPVIVVSNHPFGGLDGIVLSRVLLSIRPDVKVMANYILKSIPELSSLFVAVDPFRGKGSVNVNVGPLRDVLKWVKNGGLLCVFPAGEVSHVQIRKGGITDPKWSPSIARIIGKTGAPVLPVYFDGHNGILFQCMGMIHPLVRTMMLPGEMFKKRDGETISLKIGSPISRKALARFQSYEDMVTFLRMKTYMLRNRDKKTVKKSASQWKSHKNNVSMLAYRSSQNLRREIDALGKDNLLIASGDFRVLIANSRQIPIALVGIGRARETTFRGVGEGTGRFLDLDRFDDHYLHMFLWNEKNGEIAGAYRLGLTDHILGYYGLKGLYTRTLFHYRNRLLEEIDPAIELGRSFIKPDYQKTYQPLLLLWQGIARFVYQNPRYKILFGPVSISRDYNDVSIGLMVNYLKRNSFSHELGQLVKPSNSLKRRPRGIEIERMISSVSELRDLTNLISDLEDDRKGIPILLKHYLKMGARAIAFNVDKKFSNVIDALIVVDLTRTERRLLERHMGREESASFLEWHSRDSVRISMYVN